MNDITVYWVADLSVLGTLLLVIMIIIIALGRVPTVAIITRPPWLITIRGSLFSVKFRVWRKSEDGGLCLMIKKIPYNLGIFR